MNLQVVSLCLSSNTYLKMSSLVSILLREKRRHRFPPVTIPQQLITPLLSPRLLATGTRMKTIAWHYSKRISRHWLLLSLPKKGIGDTYEARTYSNMYDLGQTRALDINRLCHLIAVEIWASIFSLLKVKIIPTHRIVVPRFRDNLYSYLTTHWVATVEKVCPRCYIIFRSWLLPVIGLPLEMNMRTCSIAEL